MVSAMRWVTMQAKPLGLGMVDWSGRAFSVAAVVSVELAAEPETVRSLRLQRVAAARVVAVASVELAAEPEAVRSLRLQKVAVVRAVAVACWLVLGEGLLGARRSRGSARANPFAAWLLWCALRTTCVCGLFFHASFCCVSALGSKVGWRLLFRVTVWQRATRWHLGGCRRPCGCDATWNADAWVEAWKSLTWGAWGYRLTFPNGDVSRLGWPAVWIGTRAGDAR